MRLVQDLEHELDRAVLVSLGDLPPQGKQSRLFFVWVNFPRKIDGNSPFYGNASI
jgi:hypothetical protein